MWNRTFILAILLICNDDDTEENDLPNKIGIKYFSLYVCMHNSKLFTHIKDNFPFHELLMYNEVAFFPFTTVLWTIPKRKWTNKLLETTVCSVTFAH